jgi:CspA family cold shock protein
VGIVIADETTAGRPARVAGEMLWYSEAKGWGVVRDELGREMSVDYEAIIGEGFRSLRSGLAVELELAQGPRGPEVERVVALARIAPR